MSTSVPPPNTVREPEPDTDEAPWRLWMVPAAIVLGLGVGVLASILIGVVAQAGGSSLSHPTPAVSLIADVAFDLSFVAAALYFASQAGRPRPRQFGFRIPRVNFFGLHPRPLFGGLAAMAFVGLTYYILTDIYASALKLHAKDKLPSELGVGKSTLALVGAAVFVCVIAPIAEEFFFRGFIFGTLRRWRIRIAGRDAGTVLAAILTGILFGLAHTGSASAEFLIPLALLGFGLCMLRWWTHSLYPCIALHSINNSLALGINQLHWNAAEVLGLMLAAGAVIAALTGPMALRSAPA